jgi:ankyrin repeat protein
VNQKDADGTTPPIIATQIGHHKVAEILLEAGEKMPSEIDTSNQIRDT